MKKAVSPAKKAAKLKDIAASYNAYKTFHGQQYTGVKVGRGHKWYYDKGVWKDKKITPDLWEIDYEVVKRRAGHAPEGSGVPVGTEYHWYVVAHQFVKKLNANDYSTHMVGMKYKVAHKRFDKEKWSSSEKAQRNRLIKFFKDMIKKLEKDSLEQFSEPVKEKKPVKKIPLKAAAKKKAKKTIAKELEREAA